MKGILILIILIIFFGIPFKKQYKRLYTFDEFDSLCIKDSIPRNLNIWDQNEFYEDKLIIQYNYNKNDSVFYTVEFKDTLFEVTKRIKNE